MKRTFRENMSNTKDKKLETYTFKISKNLVGKKVLGNSKTVDQS